MGVPIFTIRTVTGAGALDKFLPDFQSLEITPVFSAPGTVVVKYPRNGVNAALLHDDVELAVMLNGVEVKGLRCAAEQTEGNDADNAGDGSVWTFTCRTLLGLLDRAVVYPANWPTTEPPKQPYLASNAGVILVDLLGKAQARGSLSWLTWDFTTTHDSAGVAWSTTASIEFAAGVGYAAVVQNLVDAQLCEVRMDGRKLQAYNQDTLGTDRTTGSTPLVFTRGRDIRESPRKSSIRDLTTSLLVAGSDNLYTERVASGGTLALWGRREGYVSLNNVTAIGALAVIGDAILDTQDAPLLEITHGLHYEEAVNPKPIADFDVGDWAYSDVDHGYERHRIKQWVMSVGSSGDVTGSVTLNDLVAEQIAKVHARLTSLEQGTTSPGASEEVDDGKSPHVPTGLSATTSYYVRFGRAFALVTLSWTPVTTNADGSALSDLQGYNIHWQYNGDDPGQWRGTQQVDAGTTLTYIDGIDTGRLIHIQVEAHDKYGHSSGYTANYDITTAADTIAPEKSSPPVVVSSVGTLRVIWDGLDDLGQPPPGDFAGVEVHLGPNGSFTPTNLTLKDFLTGPTATATTITQGLTYGQEYFARLVVVDTSGNKSLPSDLTSTSHAILTQVVSTEIGTGQVGLNNTAFSDVGNLVDDGSFEILTKRVERQAAMSATHFVFDSSTQSNGVYSLRHDSWAGGATPEALLLQGALPVKPGEQVFGAADYRSTTGIPGSPTFSYVSLVVRWRDAAGNQLDSTGAINPVDYTLADNWWGPVDNTWHNRVTGVSKTAPPSVTTMEIWLTTANRTAGTIWIDAVEIRKQIDTLLIKDAAITNAKIGSLAVNDANIANMSVGKLTVGTLSADITLSARIKTANTGVRAEMSGAGIQVFNGGGLRTFFADATTGDVAIIGQLSSGTGGNRITVNPGGAGLPSIYFYANSGPEFGFINGSSSGTDVVMGMNSSQYTYSGGQSTARVYLNTFGAVLETIDSATQVSRGGYMWALNASGEMGYKAGGVVGGSVWTNDTMAKIGYKSGTAGEQTWLMGSSNTRHYGNWENFPSAASNYGLFTGTTSFNAGSFVGLTITYGPTMASFMTPVITYRHASAFSRWQVTATSLTSFDMTIDALTSGSGAFSYWVFRV